MLPLATFYVSTLTLLAPMLSCVGVGVYWGRKQLPFSANFLALLVTSISTPALVFHTLVTTELNNAQLAEIGLYTVLMLAVACVLCALSLKLLGLPVRALMQTAAFPNSGNLGLPISMLAFGAQGFSAAIVFFAVCAFIQNTIGVRTLPNAGVKGAWRSPVLVASLAAVAARMSGFDLPHWVVESARLLGSVTVPLMLISLGYALSSIPMSGMRTGSVVGGLRLILGPLSAWLVGWALNLSDEMRGVLMLQMAMPCAVLSYMFATRYTDQGEVSAGAVLVSTVGFVLLAPVILIMVGASIPGW